MKTGRSSVEPLHIAVLEDLLRKGSANGVEEAVGLVFLILELGALHAAADDVMVERFLVLAAIVERLRISEMKREELIRLLVLDELEDRIHAR